MINHFWIKIEAKGNHKKSMVDFVSLLILNILHLFRVVNKESCCPGYKRKGQGRGKEKVFVINDDSSSSSHSHLCQRLCHHHHHILIFINVTTIRSAPPGVLVVVSTANAQHLRLALASLPSGDHISIKIIIIKKKISSASLAPSYIAIFTHTIVCLNTIIISKGKLP